MNELESHHGIIRKLPNIKDLTSGTLKLSQIEKIDIDDLLGRDAVKPNQYLLKACIKNKSVLITGAGGSIGSELCRQIIHLEPKKIILLEQSEYFLYEIDREMKETKSIKNFVDQKTLINLMKKNGFKNCSYRNLSGGIVAIHSGWKI